MKTLDNSVECLRQSRCFRFATCWKLERTDGTTYYFTDHDKPIVYDSNTYVPTGGFSASARQLNNNLKNQNLDLRGVLSSTKITDTDLKAGKYQDAKITEYVLDWKYPWAGTFFTAVYWITSTRWTGEMWQATVEGISHWLQQSVGKIYTRTCRHELGDSLCQVTLATYTESGKTVSQIDTTDRIFRTTGLTDADDYYNYGYVTWLTGNNAGLTHEIKDYTNSNNIIELQLETPNTIQVGDTFDIVSGCDKLQATCKNKFSNFDNYGGFPFIPTTDALIRKPSEK